MSYQKKKNHHTVAQGYLKNFRSPEGRLWRADLETETVEPKSIEKASVSFWYYTLKHAPPERRNAIEDFFAKEVEGRGIPIIDELIKSGNPTVTDEEKAALAFYIVFQRTRVPAFRDWAEEQYQSMAKWVAGIVAQTPNEMRRAISSFESATGQKLSTEQKEEVKRQWDSGEVNVPHADHTSLKTMLKMADFLLVPLCRMRWSFLRPK